jgi:hypothetical protein
LTISESKFLKLRGGQNEREGYMNLINEYSIAKGKDITYDSNSIPLMNFNLNIYSNVDKKHYGTTIAKFLPDYIKYFENYNVDLETLTKACDCILALNNYNGNIFYGDEYYSKDVTMEYDYAIYNHRECFSSVKDTNQKEVEIHMPYVELIDMWDNIDLLHEIIIETPNFGMGYIKNYEIIDRINTYNKYSLTKYPRENRPVWIKNYQSEYKVIVNRPYSYIKLRTLIPDDMQTLYKLKKIYFKPNCDDIIEYYTSKDNILNWSAEGTKKWLLEHPNTNSRARQLLDYLGGMIVIDDLSNANLHKKFEDILKDSLVLNNKEDLMRVIIWYSYVRCALFAPIFNEVKKRYKEILNKKVLYADGYTPDQLNTWFKQFKNIKYLFSTDLSRQDRQVDEHILRLRYIVYKMMGVNVNIVSLYEEMEKTWRWKAKNNSGILKFMQKTGGPDTSIGNLITDHLVSTTHLYDNLESYVCGAFLGDDNISCFDDKPNLKNVGWITANYWNIQSKYELVNDSTHFLRLIITLNEGIIEVGPDVIRLCNKFELFRACNKLQWKDTIPRIMSYLMMLGYHEKTKELNDYYGWNLPITNWYNRDVVFSGTAKMYDVSYDVVENYFIRLCNLMKFQEGIYKREIEYFSFKV